MKDLVKAKGDNLFKKKRENPGMEGEESNHRVAKVNLKSQLSPDTMVGRASARLWHTGWLVKHLGKLHTDEILHVYIKQD